MNETSLLLINKTLSGAVYEKAIVHNGTDRQAESKCYRDLVAKITFHKQSGILFFLKVSSVLISIDYDFECSTSCHNYFDTFCFCLFSNKEKYDKALTDSFGADEYRMKMYMLVSLKAGPTKIDDKTTTNSFFAGHMKNVQRRADEGKILVTSLLRKNNNKNHRRIFILNVKDIEEVLRHGHFFNPGKIRSA